ncbi:MAG: ABC transporter permease [Planctomycetaceae bacterium]
MLVGVVTATASVLIGTMLGMAAGMWGGWVDTIVTWLYSTLASIPSLVLLVLLAHVFSGGVIDNWLNSVSGDRFGTWMKGERIGDTLLPVYIAFIATFWIGPCRVIRAETLKIRELEYIQAATVMGFGRMRILLRHVLPNVTYLMLIDFSLLFIGAIKSEVILSFLGLGVKNVPSWGTMISQSGFEVTNGFFWQIGKRDGLHAGPGPGVQHPVRRPAGYPRPETRHIRRQCFSKRQHATAEDHSRIRTGLAAFAMSIVRNATINCIRASGLENIAAATRSNVLQIDRLLSRLGIVN